MPRSEPYINRNAVIVEQYSVEVRHVAAIFQAEDAAHRRRRPRNLVPAQRHQHAADQVHHQISGHARAISLPAAPAREVKGIERNLRRIVEPGIPIQRLRRKIRRRRIFPCPGGIVASQREFHHLHVADRTLVI